MDITMLIAVFCAVVVGLLLLLCFYYSSKETTFEEVYGESAIKLLGEEKTKTSTKSGGKHKQKSSSTKSATSIKTENRKERLEEQPEGEVTESQSEIESEQQTRRRRRNKPKSLEDQQHQEEIQESQALVVEAPAVVVEIKKEQKNPESESVDAHPQDPNIGSGKKMKKSKKAENDDNQPKGIDGKQTKRDVRRSATEPDVDLVIDQLKQTPINEEYLSMIVESVLLRQTYAGENAKHAEEVKKLRKQIEDNDKIVTHHMENLTLFQKKETQKIKDLMQQLAAEKSRLTQMEKSYQDKFQENQNMSRQIQMMNQEQQQLRDNYRKSMENVKSMDQIRTDAHNLKELNTRLEAELSQRQQQFNQAKISQDQQICVLEAAKQTAEKLLQDMKTSGNNKNYDDVVAKLAAKETELTEAQKEMAEVKSDLNNLTVFTRKMKAENDKNQTMIQNGESNDVEQNGQLPESSTDLKSAAKELKKKDKQVTQLSEDLKKVTDKKAELEKQVKELKNNQDMASKEKKELEEKAGKEHKETDQVIKDLMRKVELLEQERDKLTDKTAKQEELKNKDLESALNTKNKLESELKELRAQVKDKSEQTETLERQLSEMGEELKSANNQNGVLEEKECSDGKRIEELEAENKSLRNANNQEITNSADLESIQTENAQLKSEIETLKEQNIAKNEHGHKLADELKAKVAHIAKLESAGVDSPPILENDSRMKELRKQLDEQQKKNNELREKNYKALDAVNKIEETSKQLVKDIDNKYEKQLSDQRNEVALALASLLPSPKTKLPPIGKQTSIEDFRGWICDVTRILKHNQLNEQQPPIVAKLHSNVESSRIRTSDSASSGVDSELEQLKSELDTYKSILSIVDEDLKHLEASSAYQERIWEKKCEDLEAELKRIKKYGRDSSDTLKQQLSQEVCNQLTSMQTKLEIEERERDILKEQIRQLQQQLIEEQKTGRDLSAQAVKLRGMLKTGQDALLHEQNLVSQLQEQLTCLQGVGSALDERLNNGGRRNLSGDSFGAELCSLKVRLEEREKQLSKETAANKQMADKLAALGVNVQIS